MLARIHSFSRSIVSNSANLNLACYTTSMMKGESLQSIQLLVQLNINSEEIRADLQKFEARLAEHFEPQDRARIREALNIMIQAHAPQKRIDGSSYAGHPLKVALCVIDLWKTPDADLVISALFHDIVEDQSEAYLVLHNAFPKFVVDTQDEALDHMDPSYGEDISHTVGSLTNPDFELLVSEKGITPHAPDYEDAKRAEYGVHVRHAIEDPSVCLVKLSDFMMNAGSLFELPEGPRKTHFLLKYRPVVQHFIHRIQDTTIPLNMAKPAEMLSYLFQLADEMDQLLRMKSTQQH